MSIHFSIDFKAKRTLRLSRRLKIFLPKTINAVLTWSREKPSKWNQLITLQIR
jgi:hypothetical protein